MNFLPITSDGKRVYAGFWKRFCAAWVDFFVIMPFAFAFTWLEGFDKNLAIVITIPSTALFSMYNVYFNARFGGTPGKLAVGVRVTRPDGARIGWPEAWKRSAVDLAFAFLMLVVEVWALTQVSETDYSTAPFLKRLQSLQSHYPTWFSVVTIVQQVWIWSEVVVLLFNKRKRALHDFIAGTVVIHKEFAERSAKGDAVTRALAPSLRARGGQMEARQAAKITLGVCALVVASGVGGTLAYRGLTRSEFGLFILEDVLGVRVSSDILAQNLSSQDRDLVMTGLDLLEERRDPAGRETAHKLLESDDDYIWFNASMYLAAIEDQKSVPYLIKGLRHPAWRAHDRVAAYLETLTGQEFRKDQRKWIDWWKETNPELDFDFEYPHLKEAALALTDDGETFINGAFDPLRISHYGVPIRLIGIKLKENVDPEEAILTLKGAFYFQFVELRFDSGDKLDEEGARRAFVYWVRDGRRNEPRFSTSGIPPVPFKERTLVNAYLLESGLYEIDLDSVSDPEMRERLEGAVKESPS